MPVSLSDYPDLGEKTYQVLREQIATGCLPSGRQLLAAELARELGVSRTPVKDALNRLSAEGLVFRQPRKGYLVSVLDREMVVELMQARIVIETGAAERGLVLLEEADLTSLRRLDSEMRQLVDPLGRYSDYSEFARRDCAFHLAIVRTMRNRQLLGIYNDLNIHAFMVRMHYAARVGHGRSLSILKEHEAILKALEARDPQALRTAITDHLQSFIRAFEGLSPE